MAFSTRSFSGSGIKESDDFFETSRISAKFLGDSVKFDSKKHKVRCKRNCLKGIGNKSEVSTGTKHNMKIQRASGAWDGRGHRPKNGGSSMERYRVSQTVNNLRNSADELRRPNGSNMSKK